MPPQRPTTPGGADFSSHGVARRYAPLNGGPPAHPALGGAARAGFVLSLPRSGRRCHDLPPPPAHYVRPSAAAGDRAGSLTYRAPEAPEALRRAPRNCFTPQPVERVEAALRLAVVPPSAGPASSGPSSAFRSTAPGGAQRRAAGGAERPAPRAAPSRAEPPPPPPAPPLPAAVTPRVAGAATDLQRDEHAARANVLSQQRTSLRSTIMAFNSRAAARAAIAAAAATGVAMVIEAPDAAATAESWRQRAAARCYRRASFRRGSAGVRTTSPTRRSSSQHADPSGGSGALRCLVRGSVQQGAPPPAASERTSLTQLETAHSTEPCGDEGHTPRTHSPANCPRLGSTPGTHASADPQYGLMEAASPELSARTPWGVSTCRTGASSRDAMPSPCCTFRGGCSALPPPPISPAAALPGRPQQQWQQQQPPDPPPPHPATLRRQSAERGSPPPLSTASSSSRGRGAEEGLPRPATAAAPSRRALFTGGGQTAQQRQEESVARLHQQPRRSRSAAPPTPQGSSQPPPRRRPSSSKLQPSAVSNFEQSRTVLASKLLSRVQQRALEAAPSGERSESPIPGVSCQLLELLPPGDPEREMVEAAFTEDGLQHGEVLPRVLTVERICCSATRARDFAEAAAAGDSEGAAGSKVTFHGLTSTPTDALVNTIAELGLDAKRCKAALFGKGAYVAAGGAKALMYAEMARWDRKRMLETGGDPAFRHSLPLRVVVLLLAPGQVMVGEKGVVHECITTDSLKAPTQYCIPETQSHRLLPTHVITIEPPGQRATSPAPPAPEYPQGGRRKSYSGA